MPSRDPYMRDRNIAKAAHWNFLSGVALGAGTGAGAAGWFDLPSALAIGVGAALGFVVAAPILAGYGGRSTR